MCSEFPTSALKGFQWNLSAVFIVNLDTFFIFVKMTISGISNAVVRRCFIKKVFLKLSQKSQENTYSRVFFLNKVADLTPGVGVFLWILWNFVNINFIKHLWMTIFLIFILMMEIEYICHYNNNECPIQNTWVL